jgi:hypothetical protein
MTETIPYQQLPTEQVRQWAGSEIAPMFERFEANQDYVDITNVHRRFPDIGWHDFASWAKTVDWQPLLGAWQQFLGG